MGLTVLRTAAGNDEVKERVRDSSDIVRVIGEHIALKAKGREYVALCPFHDDHKPSMCIVPQKQIFHCFVCGAGGDVFRFIEKYHKMEFREALEYLAERSGIELAKRPPEQQGEAGGGRDASPAGEAPVARAVLVRANATAQEFFRAILKHPEHGKLARETIARRGISAEMVEQFGVGAGPDRWDGLVLTLQKQGLDPRAFVEAGLLKRRDEGGLYDALRHRLIFPIHDQIGRVIAFGGRKLREEDEPKYLNSPETRLFEKAGTLYGLHQASRSIQSQGVAIITEGYTDTIACHQGGFTNAVATLGTALTARHAAVLRRLCDTVILLFDGDEAGQRAADRAVEVFFAEDIDVKIATLAGVTDAKDPDELLKREGGAEVLREALSRARDLLEYRYARIRERAAGAGMAAMSRLIEDELARLVQLGFNHVPLLRRKLIVKRLAQIAGVDEQTIWRSVPGGRRAELKLPAPVGRVGIGDLSAREQALGCVLCEPSLWMAMTDGHRELLDPEMFPRGEMAAIADAMFRAGGNGALPALSVVAAQLEDPEHQGTATDLFMRIGQLTEHDPARLRAWFEDCMRALRENEHPRSLDEARRHHAANGANRRVLPRPGRTG
jgi:DNA primase